MKTFLKHQILFGGILIFLICFLAYGQILGMYFFLEDYLILYSIQQPNAPDAGYGSGIFGRPFGYAVTPFIPFYYLFGLEPRGYYFVEIFLYFLASIGVYFFAKTLTNNRKTGFATALIFASGYVGSESLYRMAVGWQNLLAAFLLSITASFYYKYVKSSNLKIYFLALFLYLLTSEFAFYRAHGIILLILGIEVLFNFKLLNSIVRMVPFVLSYYYFYVYSIGDFIDQGSKTASFLRVVFKEENYNFLLNPFKTLENLFVPDKFHLPFLVFVGILIFVILWKRSKILLYCLIFTVANFLVHFYNSPATVQETTHRYLTISFVGAASFWGILLAKVFKRKLYIPACLVVIVINLILVRADQINILQNRSQPQREFWQTFLKEVPYLPKNSAIYIDSKVDGVSKPTRDVSLSPGSMGITGSFAAYYGLRAEDIYFAETFPELLSWIKTGKVRKDDIYTFFYSRQDGLINTTKETKSALFDNTGYLNINDPENTNIPFYSPLNLNFSSNQSIDFSGVKYTESNIDLFKYLAFLVSRDHYYEKVSATATTETKYAKIGNVVDRDIATGWKGDNISWTEKRKEEIELNLGEIRQVGAVRITPTTLRRTPTKYSYRCSLDGMNWKKLGSFEKKLEKQPPFLDKLTQSNCAFVKLTIDKTLFDEAPQISEIEVLDSQFVNLEIDLAEKIEENPFIFMRLENDNRMILEHFTNNGINGKICIYSDKRKPTEADCKRYRFKLGLHEGKFFIDQGGTVLQKLQFKLPSQIKFNVINATIEYIPFSKLERMGYF